MTIKEYAKQQDFTEIKAETVVLNKKEITVYNLYNKKDEGKKIGLPFYAIPIKDNFRKATYDEVFTIFHYLNKDDEETEDE